MNFPATIKHCADAFVTLQQKRHDADYDPDCRVLRADAIEAIDLAEKAIKDLRATSKRDRRAFAAQLLFAKRKS